MKDTRHTTDSTMINPITVPLMPQYQEKEIRMIKIRNDRKESRNATILKF